MIWDCFSGKMGVAATLAPKGLELQNPTKKNSYSADLLGQLLYQNHALNIFSEPS